MIMPTAPAKEVASIERLVERMRGRKLPGERELSEQFGMSRARVRSVLSELEGRGLVHRRQGSGTYALEEGSSALNTLLLLVDEKLKLGDDPFFSLVVEKLQQVSQAEGMRCSLERFGPENKPVILEDGIFTVGLAGRQVLERLQKTDPPAVGMFLDASARPGARVSLLDLDDRAAGRTAAEYLIERGCPELCYVGHNDLPVSEARLGGAREAAKGAGRTITVLDSGMNYASGITDAHALALPSRGRRLGVIAANDWLALGLHAGLSQRGADARKQVELVSFDGLPITSDPILGIRSLAAPLETMARDAVAELRRLAARPGAYGRTIRYSLFWSDARSADRA